MALFVNDRPYEMQVVHTAGPHTSWRCSSERADDEISWCSSGKCLCQTEQTAPTQRQQQQQQC